MKMDANWQKFASFQNPQNKESRIAWLESIKEKIKAGFQISGPFSPEENIRQVL